MEVKPLTISIVNWKAVQATIPDSNCLSSLKNVGIHKEDPAAIGVLFQPKSQAALRFIFVQFIITVPRWDAKPVLLDQYQVAADRDSVTIILSGTADLWVLQIKDETAPQGDPTRERVFASCRDQLRLTGLKAYL